MAVKSAAQYSTATLVFQDIMIDVTDVTEWECIIVDEDNVIQRNNNPVDVQPTEVSFQFPDLVVDGRYTAQCWWRSQTDNKVRSHSAPYSFQIVPGTAATFGQEP